MKTMCWTYYNDPLIPILIVKWLRMFQSISKLFFFSHARINHSLVSFFVYIHVTFRNHAKQISYFSWIERVSRRVSIILKRVKLLNFFWYLFPQTLISENSRDDSNWPTELILLREKLTATSQLEIAQLKIKHEEEVRRKQIFIYIILRSSTVVFWWWCVE